MRAPHPGACHHRGVDRRRALEALPRARERLTRHAELLDQPPALVPGLRRRRRGGTEKQPRRPHDTLLQRLVSGPPRRIQMRYLARRDAPVPERLDEPLTVGLVGARQRHQRFHRPVRRDPPAPHRLLHALGQRRDERHATRYPARATAQQKADRRQHGPLSRELAQQPPFLHDRAATARLLSMAIGQGVRLAEAQGHRDHGVLPQPPEDADTAVAVDEHGAALGVVHHHHRAALADLRHRREQARLRAHVANAQVGIGHPQSAALERDRPWPRFRLRLDIGGDGPRLVHAPLKSTLAGGSAILVRDSGLRLSQQAVHFSNDLRLLPLPSRRVTAPRSLSHLSQDRRLFPKDLQQLPRQPGA